MIECNIFNIILVGYMGASIGSFIVCWTWRAQRGISIVTVTHSFCDNCNKKLNLFEVMPIFGVLFNRGKCSRCKFVYPKTSFKIELIFSMLLPLTYFNTYSIIVSLLLLVFLSLMTSAIMDAYEK